MDGRPEDDWMMAIGPLSKRALTAEQQRLMSAKHITIFDSDDVPGKLCVGGPNIPLFRVNPETAWQEILEWLVTLRMNSET